MNEFMHIQKLTFNLDVFRESPTSYSLLMKLYSKFTISDPAVPGEIQCHIS